jgi:hypothetical protein
MTSLPKRPTSAWVTTITATKAVDQRFLGDEKFIGQIAERAPRGEIRPGGRKL